jgi:2-polyprenylphenol 6-hydroxylase
LTDIKMTQQPLDYDVVIIGAGLIGLTLACRLIGKGLRLAMIDKNEDPLACKSSFTVESALRMSAITLGSQQILERCQVWQNLAKASLSPFQSIEVWEQNVASCLSFNAAETGQICLGSIVKNTDLHQALVLRSKTASELRWYFSESLKSIRYEADACVLTLTSGQVLTTQLLVGADGAQSSVRSLAGIQTHERDYQQTAVIATVQTELAHQQTARQIFLPTGPLAFLPLANPHYCSIVWSTMPEKAERLKTLTDESFCLALTKAFEQRLGKIESTSLRQTFPLKTQQCEQYVKPGIVLIGDAANTLHPLAGQGANLGIADADCLAKVVLDARQKQRSFAAWYTLRRYERERCFHHRLMGGSVDLVKQVFGVTNPLLKVVRVFGLKAIDKTGWLKNQFAQYAMGNPEINPLEQG